MISWNEEEHEQAPPVVENIQQSAASVLNGLESSPQPQEVEDDEFQNEVEKRVELVQYYKALLSNDMFNGDTSEAALTVEKEIRAFVRERIAILVGMKAEKQEPLPPPPPLFGPEEVTALKALASKVLGKPSVLSTPTQAPVAKPEPKAPPQLKKAEPPPTKTTTPKKVQSKVATPAKKAPAKKDDKANNEPSDVIVEGKKRYKKVMVTGPDGKPKEVKMDITPQARPSGIQPAQTPIGAQAEVIHQHQANMEALKYSQQSPIISIAVQKAQEE